MVRTRLINLVGFGLEEHEIGKMPPYIAVSHVWAESLFPVNQIHAIDKTKGMTLVLEAVAQIRLGQTPMPEPPAYCWIDTWCIDQHDTKDKNAQIPAMGTIYKNAEFVIIATDHRFSFSQHDWEVTFGKVKPIFEAYFQYFDDPRKALISLKALPRPVIRAYSALIQMAVEFVSIPWATRIWTAQEYILAKTQCWIGKDERILHPTENDLDYLSRVAELLRLELGTQDNLSEMEWRMLSMPQNMNLIKTGDASPLKAMSLARDRKCLMPKDQIYGLMAAAGVVIEREENDSLELAWQKWCETAIRQGSIDLVCTAATRNPTSFLEEFWNCATPPWQARCEIFQESYLPSARSVGNLSIQASTITLSGRIAGTCVIERFLCSNGLPTELEDLAALCGHDLDLARRVCFAEDGGVSPQEEVAERAGSIHAAYKYTTEAKLSKPEQTVLQQKIDAFSAGVLSRFRFGTHIYLARLVNSCSSKDVLVFTDEDLYEDDALLALDLSDISTTEDHFVGQLVVARAPPAPDSALHKAGMTSLIRFHNDRVIDVMRCDCDTYAHCEPVRQLKIGGSTCWYCEEMKARLNAQLSKSSALPEDWDPGHIESGDVKNWYKTSTGAEQAKAIAKAVHIPSAGFDGSRPRKRKRAATIQADPTRRSPRIAERATRKTR